MLQLVSQVPRRCGPLSSNVRQSNFANTPRGIVMADIVIEGGCLCGAIGYRATVHPISSMVCHCRTCRMASAAPLVPWVTFPSEHFSFVRGRPTEFHSSPSVTRMFCPSCGTPLTYQRTDLQSEIDVTTCTLQDPERFPPTHHSWTAYDLNWVRVADKLPAYEKTSRDSEPNNAL